MTYGIDAGHSLDRNPSGVGIYSRRLIEELAAAAPEDRFVLGYRSNRILRSLRGPLPGKNCSRALLEEPLSRLWASRVDLLHGLNQRAPATRFPRTVITFHDLFVMTGEYSTLEFRDRFTALARQAAERSDRIIAVSEFTAAQTAELLDYPRDRIDTIPHGVDPPEKASDRARSAFRGRLGLKHRFLLHVGAIQKRKNILRLLEAFETLDEPVLLVLAGGDGYGSEEIAARIDAGPARGRIRRLGYVDSETRRMLYQTAAALAFPSLDEGFGLPVLEAMAAGLPVVTSNRSALPEVAGDAAVLVDPLRTESIRDGLQRVLSDDELASRLRIAGERRAAEFTWAKAAERTLAVYRRVLSVR